MKRISLFIISLALLATAVAQTPSSVIDKAIGTLNAKGIITADYKITSSQGTSKGSIAMKGNKFRILSDEVKSWYDGKTMWSYSTATQEVNITNPSQDELLKSNPYFAARGYKSSFNLPEKATKSGSYYVIKLTPKKKADFKSVTLYIGVANYNIHKAKFIQNDGSEVTIAISNFKKGVKMPNPFAFNKALVPKGTEVVDLR